MEGLESLMGLGLPIYGLAMHNVAYLGAGYAHTQATFSMLTRLASPLATHKEHLFRHHSFCKISTKKFKYVCNCFFFLLNHRGRARSDGFELVTAYTNLLLLLKKKLVSDEKKRVGRSRCLKIASNWYCAASLELDPVTQCLLRPK